MLKGIEAIYKSMATGHVGHSDYETIKALFSRGGMTSILATVWLILGALSFAAITERAKFINRLTCIRLCRQGCDFGFSR